MGTTRRSVRRDLLGAQKYPRSLEHAQALVRYTFGAC
jgi:hypothetical protein